MVLTKHLLKLHKFVELVYLLVAGFISTDKNNWGCKREKLFEIEDHQ